MDIKPIRPFKKLEAKPKKPQTPQSHSDDSTLLTVPEELLGAGTKVPLLASETTKRSKKRWFLWGLGLFIVLIIVAAVGAFSWYNDALQPRSANDHRIRVSIEQGSTPDQIAQALEKEGVIKSAFAFQILLKQSGSRDKLQAGAYLLSPAQSSREILDWLVGGKVDTFNMTILPGQTLTDIKTKLVEDGFAAADIDAAFTKKYDHPLLADKPDGVNLEGYIYPETYQISSQTTVEQLLTRAFDEFYAQIQTRNLQTELKDRGFNLHEGITLASIVQMEASRNSDRKQVAQVFEKRLKDGIELGSDVTFMYIAELTGQTASPSLDSPYNTRKYKNLPPGAIANFTIDALQAVAEPASGDYLYFVAGDDGTVYFAHTEAEHQQNIDQYCTKLCNE